MSKSKVYTQDDDSKVSFEFGSDGKLIGIKKDGVAVDPNSSTFQDLQESDDALNAYRVNKHGGIQQSYEDTIEVDNISVLQDNFQKEQKKENNAQFIDNDDANPPSLAFAEPRSSYGKYRRGKQTASDVMSYPLDINTDQDLSLIHI